MVLKSALAIWLGLAVAAFAYWREGGDPAPPQVLAHYFPRQDLVVYAEFAGLDQERDAWTKTAAYKLWNETTTGALYEQTIARLVDTLVAGQPKPPITGSELAAGAAQARARGFRGGHQPRGGEGPPRCLGIVIRGGAKGPFRAVFDKVLKAAETPNGRVTVKKARGRTLHAQPTGPDQSFAWWAEGDDLVISLVSPTGPDAMMAALDGDEPSAIDHPARADLKKSADAPGFVPVGFAFFEMTALPRLPKEAVALGLDGIKRFDFRWGFDGPALQTIIGMVAPEPRKGIPAVFNQPVFDRGHLPPLPGGLAGFTVLSIDPPRLWDMLFEAVKSADPTAPKQLAELEKQLRDMLGLDLRHDLLAHIGPKFTGYVFPTKRNAPTNILEGVVQGFFIVPKAAVVIEVKDHEAVARALSTLAARATMRYRPWRKGAGRQELP